MHMCQLLCVCLATWDCIAAFVQVYQLPCHVTCQRSHEGAATRLYRTTTLHCTTMYSEALAMQCLTSESQVCSSVTEWLLDLMC